MNRIAIIGGVLVAGGVAYAILKDNLRRRQYRRDLNDREPLADDAFAAAFPTDQQPLARQVRPLIANHLPCPGESIRPDDRFDEDLHIKAFNAMALHEAVMDIESACDVLLPSEEELRHLRVADLIALVHDRKLNPAPEIEPDVPSDNGT